LGEKARSTDVYDPGRKTPMAVGNFLKENLTAVKNFTEYLAPGELKSFDELKPGTGASESRVPIAARSRLAQG
jgi:hypothetical protein